MPSECYDKFKSEDIRVLAKAVTLSDTVVHLLFGSGFMYIGIAPPHRPHVGFPFHVDGGGGWVLVPQKRQVANSHLAAWLDLLP